MPRFDTNRHTILVMYQFVYAKNKYKPKCLITPLNTK